LQRWPKRLSGGYRQKENGMKLSPSQWMFFLKE